MLVEFLIVESVCQGGEGTAATVCRPDWQTPYVGGVQCNWTGHHLSVAEFPEILMLAYIYI